MSTCVLRKLQMLVFFCLSGLLPSVVGAQVPSFEQAYAQELQALQATKSALQASSDQFEQHMMQQKMRLQNEMKQSESSLLKLKKRSRELAAERDRLAEQNVVSEDQGALLQALLAGAGNASPLSEASELPAHENEAAAFLTAVDKAVSDIDAAGRLSVSDGQFFDVDGTQVNGQIVHVGKIAALGVSPNAGGVLLKIPDGYRLLDNTPKSQAEQIVKGKTPEALDVFLFSPDCTGHDPRSRSGFLGMLDKGGPVAWVIVCLALLGVLLVIERLITLSLQTNWRPGRFDTVATALRNEEFDGACSATGKMGAVGKVLRGVIEQRSLPREDLEKRASELILKAMPTLERSLTILVVITAVAPLLGLLGTVTGMISTFDVITEFGTGDPKLLSGGISEALITTKLGLAVAVPFLLVRSLIARWADRIIENMQTYSLATLNIVFSRKVSTDV
ncbi:MAG: MotA/TolQ/ExbB proton channel family protein [Deltaproteobacteria bacterium]|nr:MotA/TolQ/ExbB proton channel family protein [Deltaproteobacteria bacterium]MBN2670147.1 MotA/TolQ/ExbB proton channel family protein [Deltaproteobacteria bacterium]